MKFKLLSLLIILFGLFLAVPVKADTSARGCETNTMKNGEYCNWAEGKSWNTSNTTICAVESTTPCPANPSNGTYNFSCNSNSCVLSCNSGYVRCNNTCTPVGSAPNCTNYNTCSGTCTTCAPGYTLSGGTCSAATLKLGSTSVGQSSLLQAGADALAYISGNKMGIGNSNPSANLHINASTDTEGLRIITSNYSPFIIRNAADTADLFRIDQDGNITSLGEITGSNNYWKLNGSDLYASTTSWNVGIGTTNPSQKLDVVGKISLNDGGNSVFIGEGAGLNDDASNNRNVGIGHQSLLSNTTGNYNTANGYHSLYFNTTGSQNTANGYQSLRYNTTGSQNTANGYQSLYFNTTGNYNTANGMYSLLYNTTGSNNTANGWYSLYSNTTGNSNTANGHRSLYSNTTGSYNIALGLNAGRYINDGGANETSSNSLYLGYDTRASLSGNTNEIVIGHSALGGGSNSVTLGNDSIAKTLLKGNVGIGTTSPQSLLDVNGLIKMRTATITADEDVINKGYLDAALTNSNFWGGSASSNIYNVNTGNVGIGTTDPASELDVEGTVNSLAMNTLSLIANLADVNTSLDVGSGGASDGVFVNGRAEISGKLGVGMSSPTYPLDVTGNARIGQADNYGLYIGGTQRYLWARASGDLALGTGGSDRLTIDSAGNVGIGITNPGSYKLYVNGGNAVFGSDIYVAGGDIYDASGDLHILGEDNLYLKMDYNNNDVDTRNIIFAKNTSLATAPTAANELMRITEVGNVGIGTTNPGTRLTVVGSGNYSIDASSYKIGNVATPTVATDAANKGYVDSAIPASLWSGTLNGNIWNGAAGAGNVGIGTTNPSSKLNVIADNNGEGIVIRRNSTADDSYADLRFSLTTSDTYNGATFIRAFRRSGDSNNNDLLFNVGGNDALMIKDSGNVGIGTTTPGSKLHVVGNANITSTLTMGGDINMANNNITAINKLTVNTIDPLYNIKGVNYSTFAPSMVGGVKEEYVGLAKIDQMLKTGEYEKIIDFDQVAEGSDLWVWHKTIDFSPNNVQVIITPIAQFANTYYFIEDDKLVLRADKEVDISYRLTGNRHDWKEWPTRALDQTEKAGFIIN